MQRLFNKFIAKVRLWSEIVSKRLDCEKRQNLKFGFVVVVVVVVVNFQ